MTPLGPILAATGLDAPTDGPSLLTITATAVTVMIGVGAILGGLIKWVVLPNLREFMVKQADIHRQLTANHHENKNPTMLDRFDDVEEALRDLDQKVDAHLISAAAVDATTAARVKAIERRLNM